jgi:hypothetical protein
MRTSKVHIVRDPLAQCCNQLNFGSNRLHYLLKTVPGIQLQT